MKLCLDIGGSNIRSAIVVNDKIKKKYTTATQAKKGRNVVLKNICKAINKFYSKEISSINIGMPGPFKDRIKGIIGNTPNMPLKNFNIKKYLYKKYKKNIKMDNDTNCYILGEAVFGAGKKYNNVIGLTLGTGIGGGIVINKKIYHGRDNAGEFGHMLMGKYDFEHYLKRLKDRSGHIRNYNMLGYYLGLHITSLIHVLDPDIVVVGGGIADNFNKFKEEMNKTIKKKSMFKPCKVVKAKLKDSGLLGASLI